MSETQEQEPQDETQNMMKTLFSRLTELAIGGVKTVGDGKTITILVTQWAAFVCATIVVMMTKDKDKRNLIADTLTVSFNRDMKNKIRAVSKMAEEGGKEDSGLILPDKEIIT